MTPSKFQKAIYDFVQKEKGSAIVEAVAGSGKTTTIVEAAKLVPEGKSVAFVAFNKSIANELKTRLPETVKSSTLNSMGFGAWIKTCNGKLNVDAQKTNMICDDVIPKYEGKMYNAAVKKLVALAKAHGLVPKEKAEGRVVLTHDTEQNWFNLIEKYGVEVEGNGTAQRLVELARIVLNKSIESARNVVDFDDQIYMPVIERSRFWQYDVLFVDEAQDVNMIQRAMLRMSLKPTGRLIAVGDRFQSIYGFRGADTESIENIKAEFSAISLPLSISYRCPKAVVQKAQQYVPHIEAFKDAPDGKVEVMVEYDEKVFQNTDGIVCRNCSPLVDFAYKLIRKGKGCRILGREIGQGLVNLIKKMNAQSVEDLETKLDIFMQRESQKLVAKGQEDKAGGLVDKVETIRVLIQELPETHRTIDQLFYMIGNLFTDNNTGLLTLSTVHKAKGLEYHRVFILEPQLMPSPWARQIWQKDQERNICYVAVTRAKSELYYIQLQGFKEIVKTKGASQ